MSFISLFEIISKVTCDPNIFIWITASVGGAAPVNPNGIKTLLANGLVHFLLKVGQFLVTVLKFYLKILLIVLFAKALRSLETCALVINNLWGKIFSPLESPAKFYDIFKVISETFFVPGFVLLICELDNFTFKVLYRVILY